MNRHLLLRVSTIVGLLVLMSNGVRAQTLPTAGQAQQALTDPAIVAQLQAKIQSSGLTPDQVRQRLVSLGYPSDLLDQVIGSNSAGAAGLALSPDVFAAVGKLSTVDTVTPPAKGPATPNPVDADSGFTIYGVNLFSRQSSEFDPNVNGPVGPDYQLGPGDQLVLTLTGDVQAAYALSVTREGWIAIPNVGQLSVANLTMAQLNNLLFTQLAKAYSGIRRNNPTTFFTVSVAGLGSQQVYVTGDVSQPGAYRVSTLGTMLTALYAAGGPTDDGTMRDIQLVRGGKTVDTLDVYDYLQAGNTAKDLRLQSGDIIFVPVRGGRIRVAGAVMRPATYELRPGEGLADALKLAGGFRPSADRRNLTIERVIPPIQRTRAGLDRTMVTVTSPLLTTGLGPDLPLQAGDVIRVSEIAPRVANRVYVTGNVWRPGGKAWSPGMRLSQAIEAAGGLEPDSYLGRVLVLRLEPDSTRAVIQAALKDTLGTPLNDITLVDDDSIHVYSLTELRPERYVTIEGAVRGGGQFTYHDGMTLRDAVLLAGGLDDGALLTEAEIAHLPENRAAGQTAETERVPLDSTYLFERTPDSRYLGPPGIPATSAASAPEVLLRPYDAISILRQPGWKMPRLVVVTGEVQYPSVYALKTRDERLDDIIHRAGGLTKDAYPDGMVLVRNGEVGRIGVSLPKAMAHPESNDNLVLMAGDSIYVPQYLGVVTVQGAVYSPTSMAYKSGAKIDYYIRASGGATTSSEVGRAYVRQANGEIQTKHRTLWIFRHNPTPGPGSTVTVPAKDPNADLHWDDIIRTTTTILGSLVAVGVLLRR